MESLPFRNGRIYGIIFGFRSEGRILAGLREGIAGRRRPALSIHAMRIEARCKPIGLSNVIQVRIEDDEW